MPGPPLSSSAHAHLLRHPAHRARSTSATTPAASASTRRRRIGARGGRRGVLLHRRPALDHGRLRPGRPARALARPGRAALRDRARPGALDRLRAEPRDRARRGGVAAVGGDELRPARPDDAVQGEGRPAGVRHRRAVHVPDPDGRRHPALPDRRTSRSATTSGSTSSSRATSPSGSTRASGQTFVVPDGDLPGGGRADHGPAGADEEDVDDGRHAAGDDPDARPARRDPQEGQERGHGLGQRGAPRRGQGRRDEPDRRA